MSIRNQLPGGRCVSANFRRAKRTIPSHIVAARAKTQKIKSEAKRKRVAEEAAKKAELRAMKILAQEVRKAKLVRMKAQRQRDADKKWREYLDSFGCAVPDFGRSSSRLAVAS